MTSQFRSLGSTREIFLACRAICHKQREFNGAFKPGRVVFHGLNIPLSSAEVSQVGDMPFAREIASD